MFPVGSFTCETSSVVAVLNLSAKCVPYMDLLIICNKDFGLKKHNTRPTFIETEVTSICLSIDPPEAGQR